MNSSLFALSGRLAVVVGGSSGIWRTLALGLADAGANVVATARREDRVHHVAAEIDAASFVTGQLLVVDGGFLTSGVNQ